MREPTLIRIGLVGAGANTRARHIPGFRAIPGVEVVSVANRTRESGEKVAGELEISKVYDTWAELIAAPDTNAICIGTWPYMHRTLVLEALAHGKHVLTEARMSMNAAEAREMLAAARAHPGLVVQVVPAPYTMEVDATIARLIAEGYLGEVLSIDFSINSPRTFVDPMAPLNWRQDADLSGLNIMTMGIWYEGLLRWIGPAAAVTALTRVNVKRRRDAQGGMRTITVPDHVEVLAEMAAGPLLHMRVSTVSGLAPTDQAWLYGTEGTLRVEFPSQRLFGGRRGDINFEEVPIQRPANAGWRVEEDFVRSIRQGAPVTHTSFEDGVRYMEFTEAVTRSAQTGRKVALPL